MPYRLPDSVTVRLVPPDTRNLVAIHGIIAPDDRTYFYLVDAQPGQAPDGSCAINVLARCETFDALLIAAEKHGAAPGSSPLVVNEEALRGA